jgi:hypothetical protein
MKNSKSKISTLIHKALLEGSLSELETHLSENLLGYYTNNIPELSKEKEDCLVEALMQKIQEKKELANKLKNIQSVNGFGEYLNIYFTFHEIEYSELSTICNLDDSNIKILINNKIPIREIEPLSLAKLARYIDLKLEQAYELITKTIQINLGNFSARNALARFDPKKGIEIKGKSMSSGINELLLKANKVQPLSSKEISFDEQTNIYLQKFVDCYRSL